MPTKSVMLSINPEHCSNIANGIKSVEIRKNKPNLPTPFKCYIYCTKNKTKIKSSDGNNFPAELIGKVIGEFTCNKIVETCGWRLKGETWLCAKRTPFETNLPAATCVSLEEILKYAGNENSSLYGWQISNFVLYDRPKELSDFALTKAPQSWCYAEEKK